MVPIVSPKPLLAVAAVDRSVALPSILLSQDAPIHMISPRNAMTLMSPIHFPDAHLPTAASPPCSPIPRRRPSHHSRTPRRRRRHCPHFDTIGPSFFDRLPWISAMETSSENISPWDIADLSQIGETNRPSSTGPVRSRKSSLRSNPLARGNPPCSEESPSQHQSTPLCDYPLSPPRTPLSHITSHSTIDFHHLMPALPCYDSHHDESSGLMWTT